VISAQILKELLHGHVMGTLACVTETQV